MITGMYFQNRLNEKYCQWIGSSSLNTEFRMLRTLEEYMRAFGNRSNADHEATTSTFSTISRMEVDVTGWKVVDAQTE
jgi:hypothetical protein